MDIVFGFVMAGVAIAFIAAFCQFGKIMGEDGVRQVAIDAGVGEYYLDENNRRQFRFKTKI